MWILLFFIVFLIILHILCLLEISNNVQKLKRNSLLVVIRTAQLKT